VANAVRDRRQAVSGKTCDIAIGVDDHVSDLRLQPIDDSRKDRPTPKGPQAFVAAPHATGFATGKQNADDRRGQTHRVM
jgi:hypothetical protein